MKQFNLKSILAVLFLMNTHFALAGEGNTAPFICKLEALGGYPALVEGNVPIPTQKLESHPMQNAESIQEWNYKDDQISVYATMSPQGKGEFRSSIIADATESRGQVLSIMSLPRIDGYITTDLDVPNGLKHNKYVKTLRLSCFDAATSAELKAKGYLEFKE